MCHEQVSKRDKSSVHDACNDFIFRNQQKKLRTHNDEKKMIKIKFLFLKKSQCLSEVEVESRASN